MNFHHCIKTLTTRLDQPYEPESESDNNDEEGGPTAKRANAGGNELAAKRARELHALGVAGAIGVLLELSADETP